MQGNITDITNLKFYTDKGTELSALKNYVLRWELIPGEFAKYYLLDIPTGYFMGDVDLSSKDPKTNETIVKIANGSFITGILNTGKFFVRMSETHSTDGNGLPIFAYSERALSEINGLELRNYIERIFLDIDNKVKIIIEDDGIQYTNTFNVNDIFTFDLVDYTEYEDYFTVQEVFDGDNLYGSNEYFLLLGLKRIDLILTTYEGETMPYIQSVFTLNVKNIGYYFPFVRYNMNMYLDKVSTNFIAANTVLILETQMDVDGNIKYEKPYIDSNNPYVLVFLPTVDSEIKIISSDSEYNIKYVSEADFSLADKEQSETITPLSFSFGFLSAEEGAYQNLIGIYMRTLDKHDDEIMFFMGCISVKTEVEGEDERFRTLLTNFGIPDPVLYSNIFAEQEYDEEGKDFTLINRKSKELFLTYSEIFSYVGTYKALIKAIKFLGYTDIIFKEWYTLKDSNDKETDVAVQVFDSETGEFLKSKLAEYGVSIEDFERYNKINKISMIYHLNERDTDNYERIEQTLMEYDETTGKMKPSGTFTLVTEVPLTRPIYAYRTAEVLAKLFAVKKWLEYNIIGVGAYITDISGEGIYFGWQKTQGYETTHHLADFSQELYCTADVKCVLPFVESHGKVVCTLNELNDAVRLQDYADVPLCAFIRDSIDVSFGDVSTFYISNTLETPVLSDEYEFELNITPESGTLYEWCQGSVLQLIVDSGEIKMLFNDNLKEAIIDASCGPIITLENANIHMTTGSWADNVVWSINEAIDPLTGNVHYRLKNVLTGIANNMYSILNNRYFMLKPVTDNAYIKYSDKNDWEVPMFIIKGYDIIGLNAADEFKDEYTIDLDKEYILEILKGDILFKRIGNVSAKLLFSNDNILQEQNIDINYTYYSDRKQFVSYDSSLYEELQTGPIIDPSAYDDIINESKEKLDKLKNKTLSRLSNNGTEYENLAYNEAQEFLSSDTYVKTEQAFLEKKRKCLELADMYKLFNMIYDMHCTTNKTIDVDVTRLGNYNVIARTFDKYNNMFISKYDKTANVSVKPISIDLFTDSKYSNNKSSFYKDNIDGILCSSTLISEILSEMDIDPLYPTNYKILDFKHDINSNRLTFDNISYAYDTPKNNDYLVLDNNKDKVSSIDSSLLIVNDRHNDFIDRYNIQDYVNVTAYDQHKNKEYIVIENAIIKSIDITDSKAYVTLDSSIDDVFDESLSYYIKNTTLFRLSLDYIHDIDYDNKQTIIKIYNRKPFKNGDVVKLRFVLKKDNPETNIINEIAYRIINVEQLKIAETYIGLSVCYIYTLNGLIPVIDNNDIEIYIMYANQYPVHYTTRVIGDAVEYNQHINYNLNILKDELHYNTSLMLFDRYIDDNYSGYCYDYDLLNLKKQWFKFDLDSTNVEDIDLYYYHNYPITINKHNYLILKSHDRENAFIDGYNVEWVIKANTLDDRTNMHDYIENAKNNVIFRSANRVLSIMPSIIGPLNIELICTDIYGNKLINSGNCKLYVKNEI